MKSIEIPERYTGTAYVLLNTDVSSCLYGNITVSGRDYSNQGDCICIGTTEIDVPLKRQEEVADQQIRNLRSEKQKIIDTASEQARQIDEQIQSLLAIEHKEPSDETA